MSLFDRVNPDAMFVALGFAILTMLAVGALGKLF